MSAGNVERIIKKYADQIRPEHPNLPERCYPHMIRRTRATNLYQDGTELELISRILGHSSTETTRIYAVPSVEMMRKATSLDRVVRIAQIARSTRKYLGVLSHE